VSLDIGLAIHSPSQYYQFGFYDNFLNPETNSKYRPMLFTTTIFMTESNCYQFCCFVFYDWIKV